MNLYFRMIRILIMSFFQKKKVSPYSATELEFRVWPFDLDINMHMNNARYLSIMDLGRVYHTSRSGVLYHSRKNKWMPVVAKLDIRYIRSLAPFEKFTLRTEITGHDEKYFHITQTFIRNGEEVTVAHVQGVFLAPGGKKVEPETVINTVLKA